MSQSKLPQSNPWRLFLGMSVVFAGTALFKLRGMPTDVDSAWRLSAVTWIAGVTVLLLTVWLSDSSSRPQKGGIGAAIAGTIGFAVYVIARSSGDAWVAAVCAFGSGWMIAASAAAYRGFLSSPRSGDT